MTKSMKNMKVNAQIEALVNELAALCEKRVKIFCPFVIGQKIKEKGTSGNVYVVVEIKAPLLGRVPDNMFIGEMTISKINKNGKQSKLVRDEYITDSINERWEAVGSELTLEGAKIHSSLWKQMIKDGGRLH